MKAQFKNQVIESMLYWLDNKILTKGEAFYNCSSQFYPVNNTYNGYFTYGAPFNQLIYDSSITGANIPTGIYINSNFVTVGQSGLAAINYNRGQVLFTGQLPLNTVISGDYSIKDFNIKLTNRAEEVVLFETKYSLRPKTTQNLTGLPPQVETYPIIYIKSNGGKNDPFAFGGHDLTKNEIRLIILSDSQFNLDAVYSIIEDSIRTNVPIITSQDIPFNNLGSFKSGVFNYSQMEQDKFAQNEFLFIENIYGQQFNENVVYQELQTLNPAIFAGMVTLEISKPRWPRA